MNAGQEAAHRVRASALPWRWSIPKAGISASRTPASSSGSPKTATLMRRRRAAWPRSTPERRHAPCRLPRLFRSTPTSRRAWRTLSLAVELRRIEEGPVVLLEARNVSKQREAEYMLDPYSRMAEKNARELQRERNASRSCCSTSCRARSMMVEGFRHHHAAALDAASVLMLDFIGFTDMAIASDPGSVVPNSTIIFSAFDRITELFGCERIKTIGDAYVAVSGRAGSRARSRGQHRQSRLAHAPLSRKRNEST